MGLFDFLKKKQQPQQAISQPTQQLMPQTKPQPTFTKPADGNYIGMVSDILGPTPEERAAQERKIAENKAKMNGWLGLFQGLGALGDLYYAGKGVNPSKPDPTPQATINQQFADEQKRLDDLYKNRQAYATMLYNLQRQARDDDRRDKLADAQSNWYNTREEMARDKAELDRLKSVRVIKQTDGSLVKFNPITGETEQLKEADPLYIEYKRSQINRNNRAGTGGSRGNGGNQGTYGYKTIRHRDPATGDIITTRTPTTGGKQEVRRTPAKQASSTKPAGAPKQKPQAKGKPANKQKSENKGNKSGFFNK